jgi:hypothetical protein
MKCCDGGLVQENLAVVWRTKEESITYIYVTHITYMIWVVEGASTSAAVFQFVKNSSTSLTAPVHLVNTTFSENSYKGLCSFE